MDDEKKNVTIMFTCEKELRDQYYEVCQQNGVSANALLRGFMRRAVRDWKNKKINSNESTEKAEKNITE